MIMKNQNRECKIVLYGFIVYIKTNDIYKNIAEDFEARFNSSIHKLHRPLLKGKYKKVIGLIKRWIRWKNRDKTCGINSKNF